MILHKLLKSIYIAINGSKNQRQPIERFVGRSIKLQPQVKPVDVFVGNRLRETRINAGETIEDIAVYLAIKPTVVRRFEMGRQRVSAARLFMLAKRFDIPVAAFFPIGGELK